MLGGVECETAIVVLNVIAISGILVIVTSFAIVTKIRFVTVIVCMYQLIVDYLFKVQNVREFVMYLRRGCFLEVDVVV
jgi:hypothetical protein